MTRKDFELIARVLSDAHNALRADTTRDDVVEYVAKRMAVDLATTNDLFDRERFLRACGVA